MLQIPNREALQKKPSKSIWTPELSAKCLELSDQGFTASQIRDQLKIPGLSRNAVIGKIHRSGRSVGGGKRFTNGAPRPKKARPNDGGAQAFRMINHIRRKRAEIASPPPLVPLPPPEPTPSLAPFLGITLERLTDDVCHFPQGLRAPYLFCGQPVQEGSSFCPDCHAICWRPRDRSRDKVRASW